MPDQPNAKEEPASDETADPVEESDEESFPASDPPSSWAGEAD